jgi:serine phosphatase RsbU (regulator of sigma subunit)
LSLWLEALNISKMIADPESEAEACNQLGLVYLRLSSHNKALEYFSISLKLREEMNDENAIASTLNRIGMVLRQTKKYHESLRYYFRSLAIREKNQQLSAIPWTYLGIASTYEASGTTNEALNYFLRGSKSADPRCKLQCMMGAGRMHSLKGNKEQAEEMLRASLLTARHLKALTLVADAYSALAAYYESIGDNLKALGHYRLFQETRESLLSEEAQSRLRNVEISHAVEKSEQEKEIFRLRNVELKKAYDLIQEKNRDITSSINYASRIQTAILPKLSDLKSHGKNLFILYIPKDIVSGDFYWFTILDGKLVLVAGDCTGHGVPGALMSMLGISLLEEIVNNRKTNNPASILEELGKKVKRSLHQDGYDNQTRDGMDMSVCIIDNKNKRVNFSGANNNLYLLRNGVYKS